MAEQEYIIDFRCPARAIGDLLVERGGYRLVEDDNGILESLPDGIFCSDDAFDGRYGRSLKVYFVTGSNGWITARATRSSEGESLIIGVMSDSDSNPCRRHQICDKCGRSDNTTIVSTAKVIHFAGGFVKTGKTPGTCTVLPLCETCLFEHIDRAKDAMLEEKRNGEDISEGFKKGKELVKSIADIFK